MPLTIKQQRFVDEYLQCFNATEAALKAEYSPATARTQGSFLLTNVDIRAEIEARVNEYAAIANEVLHHLANIARADIGDLVDESGNLDLKKARQWGKTGRIKHRETAYA